MMLGLRMQKFFLLVCFILLKLLQHNLLEMLSVFVFSDSSYYEVSLDYFS